MNKAFALIAALFLSGNVVSAQKVSYQVSFPNIIHHEAKIEVEAMDFTQKELVYRMSRSSPGRYATHEYGKNIYDVKATDKAGKPVTITRLDGDVYKVSNLNGYVKVVYTLYANYPDGTYAGVDQSSVQLNMPATFMWVKGLEKAPIEIGFKLPANKKWAIATQLKPTSNPNIFTAPDLQYFMDSPIKIGDLTIKEWKLTNPDNKVYNFRLALEAAGEDTLKNAFAEMVKRVTQEAQMVYGELPAFDYGQYTFLASINPYVKGDGMEHRNSTMIALPVKFNGTSNLLGVFSHEFFHSWNVERIRPKSLEPFNYEKSNMSFELWFAEGFTQYYGELLLKRANFDSLEEFCGTLSSLINTKENTAGAKRVSPVQASCQAVFVDAGVAVDKTNYPNTYTSYYPYGASIALALELELRSRNLTLDDFMKAVWQKHGKTEIPYFVSDLENVLASFTRNEAFAYSFFEKYVNGHQSFDYAPLLKKAGLTLKRQFEGQAWLGDNRYEDGSSLKLSSNTIVGTPLYDAGLDIDDQILKVDGKTISRKADLDGIIATYKPGDQLNIEYQHRDETKMGIIKLIENPKFIVQPFESSKLAVSEEIVKFRKGWLESKVVR
ncbi:M61 family metallopeptidase [Dyadobacter sp. NIV53]|uniref:M61 family metallopeptidase n=1 Tax=Dyadobacter sp. NIV53 TaxID=2861765 RepID=UPI001C881E18|nr:PDZ domain-containing protein [Dyadobacter sp. NIV53]